MVYSSQLQRNTGIVDPLIFSEMITDSYFWYHGYSTVKNHFVVRKNVLPENTTVTFGSKTTFRLPIIADKCCPLQLVWTAPAITSDGTYTRYQDFLGYVAWERIDLLYSTGDIYQLTPEDLWMKYRQSLNIEHRDSVAEMIAGDKSPSQRDTLATTAQTLYVDLSFPHTRATSRWLEHMQLAHEPRVEVIWRRKEDFIETDGTAASVLDTNGNAIAFTDCFLRATYVHLDGDERDANSSRVESEDGIIRLFDDFKIEEANIPANTSGEYTIKMNNFRTTTKKFAFIIRRSSDLQTSYAKNYFGNLVGITSWWLEGADGKIIEPIEDRYNRYYLHSLYHTGPAGEYIYEASFAIAPDDLLNATGSYNFGNTTNATLHITLVNK